MIKEPSRRKFIQKLSAITAAAFLGNPLETLAGEARVERSNQTTRKRIAQSIISQSGDRYLKVGNLMLPIADPSDTNAPGEYKAPFDNGVPLIEIPKNHLDLNVTKNFKLREFALIPTPENNAGTGVETYEHAGRAFHRFIRLDPLLPEKLQTLRDTYGEPLKITSPFRNVTYNSKVSKTIKSRHVAGQAADVQGSDVDELYSLADSQFANGGVGYYPAGKGNFVHVDTRDDNARW